MRISYFRGLIDRDIKTMLMYTQMINLTEDEFACKAAKAAEEATQLIESGFDYVTDIEGCKLFKKRKCERSIVPPKGPVV